MIQFSEKMIAVELWQGKGLVDIANKRQLDVDQAEKDFEDISSVIYCEKHIGETFSGRISKFRMCSPEESYDDTIVVIVKNEEKVLSQVIDKLELDDTTEELSKRIIWKTFKLTNSEIDN